MTDIERELRDMMKETAGAAHHIPRADRKLVRRARLRRMQTVLLAGTAAAALVIGGFTGARSLFDDAAPIPPAEEMENMDPSAGTYDLLGVEVSLRVPDPWTAYSASSEPTVPTPNERTGGPVLALEENPEEHLGLDADPHPVGSACQPAAGHDDPEAVARGIRSDDDLETTAPVAVNVGGVDGLRMDVRVRAGAKPCSRWGPGYPSAPMVLAQGHSSGATLEGGSRMRLYLLDTPWRSENWSRRVFALWIVAPEARFERVVKAAQPILDSIEFHGP